MKHKILFTALFFACALLFAKDFGMILDESFTYGGSGDDSQSENTLTLVPRFSAIFNDNASLFVSAGLSMEYLNEEWTFIPELLRTEFLWFAPQWELTAGRMYYSDPLGLFAEGLFDGAYYSFYSGLGTFSAGAWYTGLLYKKRANINMTPAETTSNAAAIDYSDFFGTYFAPRRLLTAFDWEHLSFMDFARINAVLLAQFDLTDEELHSQYLSAEISIPIRAFRLDLGGGLQFIQNQGEFELALMGQARASQILSAPFAGSLSFLARYAGAATGGTMAAFLPLTTRTQGAVFGAPFSGITMLSLEYLARLHSTFSAALYSSYFIRNDLVSYQGYISGTDGYFLGNEFYCRAIWSPLSDIQINFGSGIFLPSLGNVAPDAKAKWQIDLNVVFSIF